VYAPLETEFLRRGAAAGCTVMSGAELYCWQGIRSYEIFTGGTLGTDVIDAAKAVIDAEVHRRSDLGL
jgi:shikimate 5-dehydrogenase